MSVANEISLRKQLQSFHDDEEGMESLQIVIIVGIAAVILILLVAFWTPVKAWFQKQTGEWKKSQDSV